MTFWRNAIRAVGNGIVLYLILFIPNMIVFSYSYHWATGYLFVMLSVVGIYIIRRVASYNSTFYSKEDLVKYYPTVSHIDDRLIRIMGVIVWLTDICIFIQNICVQYVVVPQYISNEVLLVSDYGMSLQSLALLRSIPGTLALEVYSSLGPVPEIWELLVPKVLFWWTIVINSICLTYTTNYKNYLYNLRRIENADNKI